MDSIPAKFRYGRCPCCDRIIPVPAGTNKVHCCYCGEAFLARSAIVFYGYQKNVSFTTYTPIPAENPSEHKPEPEKHSTQDYSVPRMMTIREIAKETGISEYGIRRMVKEGKIPSVNVGSKFLINYSKVCELLNQGLLGY